MVYPVIAYSYMSSKGYWLQRSWWRRKLGNLEDPDAKPIVETVVSGENGMNHVAMTTSQTVLVTRIIMVR